jgi:hypothetical protein
MPMESSFTRGKEGGRRHVWDEEKRNQINWISNGNSYEDENLQHPKNNKKKKQGVIDWNCSLVYLTPFDWIIIIIIVIKAAEECIWRD